ncbi:MAG: DNA polymerase III subunit epsilon [Gammaproteobacteria bacterium]|jgi:DNA polymerase III subunit epsilon|nr:DNA polymerase III subunit epsilon [Gammaproteobacteria bacterium]MBT7307196.1 DNA polymerase III subunit epsilon [Gammaproteobacteria bacterium]
MRQIVLDTETTGLEPKQGHRIIEIGCVEMVNRQLTNNHYHQYIQPDRVVDGGAIEVHGITNKFLADKPRFEAVVDDFIEYVRGAELIIHNAPFDVGFINHELGLLERGFSNIDEICTITDTLQMARKQYPGQKNSLDALCRRLDIDNSQRTLHGALLDSEILAEVYLSMTGGQTGFDLDGLGEFGGVEPVRRLSSERPRLPVTAASREELVAHQAYLEKIGSPTRW